MKLTGSTFGDLYGPVMEITTQAKADAYFKALVKRVMEIAPERTRSATEAIVRMNIGYWTGHQPDEEVSQRVFRLFRTEHPIFGTKQPSPIEAFETGAAMARAVEEDPTILESSSPKVWQKRIAELRARGFIRINDPRKKRKTPQ